MSTLDEFAASAAPPTGETQQTLATIEPHALAILTRSEIDAQMSSADHRPRELAKFRSTVLAIATLNEEAALECSYALPARRDGGEPIEGPSVRFADILRYSWPNSRVGVRIIEEAHDHVTAQGIFNDVENNTVSTSEVRRRIVDKRGRRYSPDMINVTANAALAIARRNTILQAIPKPLWHDLYKKTRAVAAGAEGDLSLRLDQAFAAFKKDFGIDEERVLSMLGVPNRAAINRDAYMRLRGIYTAVKDGTVSVKDVTAPSQAEKSEQVAAMTKSALDAFANPNYQTPSSGASRSPSADDSGGDGGAQHSIVAADEPPAGGPPHQSGVGTDERPSNTLSSVPPELETERQLLLKQAREMAIRTDFDVVQRREMLGELRDEFVEASNLPGGYINNVIETWRAVLKKGMSQKDAQKYLDALPVQ